MSPGIPTDAQYWALRIWGWVFRTFRFRVGSSCTLVPKPYESANDGSGVPQAAANGFGVGVGTGVGVGCAG